MHVSYISLALFAVGAIAAPAAPKPDGDMTTGFPFNPSGSSTVQDSDDGFDSPFPVVMHALEQAQSSKQSGHPSPTQGAGKPDAPPIHAAMASNMAASTQNAPSFPAPVASQAATSKAPKFSHIPMISGTPVATPSHAVIHSARPSSATPSSSAALAPAPTVSAPSGRLGGIVHGLPVVGDLVGGPVAGLGLRR
ncbi:hypothetical protein N7457_004076 [Penicillium paradoxum]|uniref:uncharacterized protein n=1 Tax=Penicillium paradoxum TaxID=176176 RepID=UPI00254692A6|nr:uncharacterized protein N7457_004076 [Penicillium paradoxum]KAJ5782302.1 hypothetical protein N7457_004076 [Penicillium paradoxum]